MMSTHEDSEEAEQKQNRTDKRWMKCGNVDGKGKWHSFQWKIDWMQLSFKWDWVYSGIMVISWFF